MSGQDIERHRRHRHSVVLLSLLLPLLFCGQRAGPIGSKVRGEKGSTHTAHCTIVPCKISARLGRRWHANRESSHFQILQYCAGRKRLDESRRIQINRHHHTVSYWNKSLSTEAEREPESKAKEEGGKKGEKNSKSVRLLNARTARLTASIV